MTTKITRLAAIIVPKSIGSFKKNQAAAIEYGISNVDIIPAVVAEK